MDSPRHTMTRSKWYKVGLYSREIALVLSAFTLLLLLIFGYQLYHETKQIAQERSDRSDAVSQAICAVIKAIPEGNPRIDTARSQFHCGPYAPPPLASATPKHSPSPTHSSSARSSHSAVSPHTATSTATRTMHATATVTHSVHSTATVTHHSTTTRTIRPKPSTVTKTVRPTSSDVLCGVLKICLGG